MITEKVKVYAKTVEDTAAVRLAGSWKGSPTKDPKNDGESGKFCRSLSF